MADLQATERLGAGSVYFVLFGSGDAGELGISCTGCGVLPSAMVTDHCLGCSSFTAVPLYAFDTRRKVQALIRHLKFCQHFSALAEILRF